MEDYGDLYNDITLRRTVSGRHIKSGSAESVNEDDFEVTRSVYEQSAQQQQQQPHHPRRRSKKAWAAIIATALVAIGAIGYCTHELVLSRSAIRSSQARQLLRIIPNLPSSRHSILRSVLFPLLWKMSQ